MVLLPYRTITFNSRLYQTEAIERFRRAVFTDLPPPLYFRGPTDYLVKIRGNRFTAKRLQEYSPIPGRKGYAKILPVVQGQFVDTPSGSILLIKMYPPFFGVLIIGSLLLASLYLIFRDSQQWLTTGHLYNDGVAFLLAAVLSYILLVDSFDPEVERIKTFLNDLYQDEECT